MTDILGAALTVTYVLEPHTASREATGV